MLFEIETEKVSYPIDGMKIKISSVSYKNEGILTAAEMSSISIDSVKHRANTLASSLVDSINNRKQMLLRNMRDIVKDSVPNEGYKGDILNLINALEYELARVEFAKTERSL